MKTDCVSGMPVSPMFLCRAQLKAMAMPASSTLVSTQSLEYA